MVMTYTNTNIISIPPNIFYYYQGSDPKYSISSAIPRATNDTKPLNANRLQIIDTNNNVRTIMLATTKIPPVLPSPFIINKNQRCFLHLPPLANGDNWSCINSDIIPNTTLATTSTYFTTTQNSILNATSL